MTALFSHGTPTTVKVTFDRIGRTHNPPELVVQVETEDDLGTAIYRHARRFLGSRSVDIYLSDDEESGEILCGMRLGGTFKVEQVAA